MCGIFIIPAYALFQFPLLNNIRRGNIINNINVFSLKGGEVQVRYGLFGFESIEEELTFIVILSVILVILLILEYWQKKLEEEQVGLKELIYYTGMFIKYMRKRWREKRQLFYKSHS